MRTPGLAIVCCVALAGHAGVAHAESASGYVRRGEHLARAGRLTEAIDAFKRADRVETRAQHACLIALAYLRRELWPQAEMHLAVCQERATPQDPLPDWAPLAVTQLRERLGRAKVARVAIRIEPAGLPAKVAVSSFAPDERFDPRTVHLPHGRHLISATAPGHGTVMQSIDVTDSSAREVVLRFDEAPRQPSRLPAVVTGVGGATLAAGVAYHLLAFQPIRDELAQAANPGNPDRPRYDELEGRFDRRRAVTMALYGAGAAVVVTGLVLRHLDRRALERVPQFSVRIGEGGAMAAVEWRR